MRKKPIVAILYDFDSTLSRTDMQNFGFIPSLGMTPAEFWGATGKFSEETGCERTLAYLYMMQKLAAEKESMKNGVAKKDAAMQEKALAAAAAMLDALGDEFEEEAA